MTKKRSAEKPEPLIDRGDWARGLNRTPRTVDNYIRRGIIPPADLAILGRPKWRLSTYNATLKRLAGESEAA